MAYLLLSIIYVASGKLGLMLALPPGYSSPIFPPAGIAVAAALIGGRRTLPWIFIGSLILNLWVGYSASQQINMLGFTLAAIIAIASMLQAALGGWVLRRIIGYPVSLDHGGEVLRFLLLAPLICLTSASLSVCGLWSLGFIDATSFATNWAAWWVGDTLGVIVMLPIVLIAVGEPRALWQQRKRTVAVPMLLVFTLFVMIFLKANQWEYTDSLTDFRQFSQQIHNRVQNKLEEQESLLEETTALFTHEANGHVTREGFHRFVQKSLSRFTMIQALEWAPGVDKEHRAIFETAQRNNFPGFEIWERNTEGQMRRAGERALFYPVTYVEPLAGNEPAVGFDLTSNLARMEALDKAIQSGKLVTTAPVQLVQEKQKQSGLLLILAVNPLELKAGVVLTVLRMGDFMEKLLLETRPMLYSRLIDLDEQKTIYDNFTLESQRALYENFFEFGSRHYRLETAPTPAYFMLHRGWQSWSVLAAGILGTGLLGALFLLGTGYTARIEAEVEDRTRKLKDSESRFRNILDHAPIGMAIASLDGHIIKSNDVLCTILGYRKDELEKLTIREITHPDDVTPTMNNLKRMLDGDVDHYRMEKRFLRKDGQIVWALLASHMEKDENGELLYNIGQIEDITERKLMEQSRDRLVRALKLLSDCNAVLVRADNEQELLIEICRLVVETGDYLMAWVGVADHDADKTVRPIAQYGFVEGYLDNAQITWADIERGRGSTGTAIRTGQVVVNDIQNSPVMSPWRDAAINRGYKASIALPLFEKAKVWGALVIYSKETTVFSREEVNLLEELSKDISFGIEVLRTRVEKEAAQLALKRESEKSLALIRNASDGIHILDQEGNLVEFSDSFCVMLGYTRNEMIGMNVSKWDVKFRDAELTEVVRQLYLQHGRSQFETLHKRKDGSIIDVEVSSFPLELGEKPVLFCSSRNITSRKQAELELNKYKAIIETSEDAIISKNLNGVIESWNHGAEKIFGYTANEAIGHPIQMLIPKDLLNEESEMLARITRGESVHQYETVRRHKDGRLIDVSTSISPIVDDTGKVIGGSKITRDITERKRAEKMLLDSEVRLEEMFENLSSGVAVYQPSPDGQEFIFKAFNKSAERIDNVRREDLLGRNVVDVFPGISELGLLEVFRRVWHTGKNEHLPVSFYQDGKVSGWKENYVYKLANGEIVAIYNDVTKEKQIEEKLKELAHFDSLTGLPNRTLFNDRLQQSLIVAKRDKEYLAFMFLDLDKFKPVNDTYGHNVGDQLLREVAIRLQECVRESDTVSRIGGDEFIILLPSIDATQDAMLVAQKILQALNQSFELAGHSISISGSIGIAVYPEHGSDEKILSRNADIAMYYAKSSGRNIAVIYQIGMENKR